MHNSMQISVKNSTKTVGISVFLKEIAKNKAFYLMMLPGLLYILVIYYLPMCGIVMAFEDFNPIKTIFGSEWIGFKNFEFLFGTDAVISATINTISYNLIFMVTGIGLAMIAAILLNETGSRLLTSTYKSVMLFPYLLSWVVVQYLVYALLCMDKGMINSIIQQFGKEPVDWYSDPSYWRVIIPIAYLWKNIGYQSVIFVAGLSGISPDYYEAAEIDGATKLQQTLKITIPMLMPITIILVLLQAGKIFYGGFGDWGIFFNLPNESGNLLSATDVIDTYVFRTLRSMGDFGMSSAAGLYQSCVGFILVLLSNWVIRKYDRESALF